MAPIPLLNCYVRDQGLRHDLRIRFGTSVEDRIEVASIVHTQSVNDSGSHTHF
jgi:hypothetical protein